MLRARFTGCALKPNMSSVTRLPSVMIPIFNHHHHPTTPSLFSLKSSPSSSSSPFSSPFSTFSPFLRVDRKSGYNLFPDGSSADHQLDQQHNAKTSSNDPDHQIAYTQQARGKKRSKKSGDISSSNTSSSTAAAASSATAATHESTVSNAAADAAELEEQFKKFNEFFGSSAGGNLTRDIQKKLEEMMKDSGVGGYQYSADEEAQTTDDMTRMIKDLDYKQKELLEMSSRMGIADTMEQLEELIPDSLKSKIMGGDPRELMKELYDMSDETIADLLAHPEKIEDFVNNYEFTEESTKKMMDRYSNFMNTSQEQNDSSGLTEAEKRMEQELDKLLAEDGLFSEEELRLSALPADDLLSSLGHLSDKYLNEQQNEADELVGAEEDDLEDEDDNLDVDWDEFERELNADIAKDIEEDQRKAKRNAEAEGDEPEENKDNKVILAKSEKQTEEEGGDYEKGAYNADHELMFSNNNNEEIRIQQDYYATKMQQNVLKTRRKKLRKDMHEASLASTLKKPKIVESNEDERDEDNELEEGDSGYFDDEKAAASVTKEAAKEVFNDLKSFVNMKNRMKEIRDKKGEEEESKREALRIKRQNRLGIREAMVESVRKEDRKRRGARSSLKLFNFTGQESNNEQDPEDLEREYDHMTPRQRSISKKVHETLNHVLLHDFKDSRADCVEVTYVEVAKDLRTASVKWESSNERMRYAEMNEVNKLLNKRAGFLGSRVGQTAALRYAPAFTFYFDARLDDPTAPDELKPGAERRVLMRELTLQYDLDKETTRKLHSVLEQGSIEPDTEFRSITKKSSKKKKKSTKNIGGAWF